VAEHAGDGADTEVAEFLAENRLRAAVAADALELAFQPQYDLGLGQMMGVEALLSWPGDAPEVVSSERAFAAAEDAGTENRLASALLNSALRNVSEFRYSAGLDLRVALKMPATALLNTDLPDITQSSLGTWRLRPGRLILDITHTALLASQPIALETLARLKKVGIKLAIADSNVSLSSLFAFATLPFDEIRLDVSSALESASPKQEQVLRSMIQLARELRWYVLAAGVRDDAFAERLKEFGCDFMQADYRGPAVFPKDFEGRYRS